MSARAAELLAAGPGIALERHAVLDSTIDRCRELAESGGAGWTVVLADAQRAGRGQPGHSWHSPAGRGLYLSVLLRPSIPPARAAILGPLVGLAACEALRGLGVPCRVKLPNDLVAVAGGRWRKLGGMIVDTAVQADALRHAIVSLGVNVSLPDAELPADLRGTAVSCHDLGSPSTSRDAVAWAFLRELAALLPLAESRPEELLALHAAHVRPVRPGDPAEVATP